MRAFAKMLAGASFALVVILLAATLALTSSDPEPTRTNQSERIQSLSVGDSNVFFHFEQFADVFELYVMIVARKDHTDMLQTRMKMKDGQRFSMLLHDATHNEARTAHKLIFDRVEDSVLVTTIEAERETVIASASRLLD